MLKNLEGVFEFKKMKIMPINDHFKPKIHHHPYDLKTKTPHRQTHNCVLLKRNSSENLLTSSVQFRKKSQTLQNLKVNSDSTIQDHQTDTYQPETHNNISFQSPMPGIRHISIHTAAFESTDELNDIDYHTCTEGRPSRGSLARTITKVSRNNSNGSNFSHSQSHFKRLDRESYYLHGSCKSNEISNLKSMNRKSLSNGNIIDAKIYV